MTALKRILQLSIGLALVSTTALWAGTQDVAPAVIGSPTDATVIVHGLGLEASDFLDMAAAADRRQ
jgi:hypothetical protein